MSLSLKLRADTVFEHCKLQKFDLSLCFRVRYELASAGLGVQKGLILANVHVDCQKRRPVDNKFPLVRNKENRAVFCCCQSDRVS